jgi:two-component system, response regulator PdtaR
MNKGLKIAVADDERDMREYLHEVLPRLGHEVVAVAENGRKLVEQCRAARPDLVITDIKMPDMDGIETSVAVNRDRQTPVILISALHDAETMTRVGVDHVMGYLVKPVSEADLKTAITMAMLRYQHFLSMLKENSDLKQTLEDRKLIEKAKGVIMKRLRVDEEEAFRRVRKLASNHNLKLVAVSKQVIDAEEVFVQLEKV